MYMYLMTDISSPLTCFSLNDKEEAQGRPAPVCYFN